MNVHVELGPKGKKHAAYAIDWPGLERGGKTPEIAVEQVELYRKRYEPIAALARMKGKFADEPPVKVVETYEGPGSTDFWGISFKASPTELEQEYSIDRFRHDVKLLQACWQFFDDVLARVSPELRKGPRGGGRDRDQIARHVLVNEADWARKVGVEVDGETLLDPGARQAYRHAFIAGLQAFQPTAVPERNRWTLSFLIRHSAFHTLDHAWEMEDKDLTGSDE